MGLFDFLKKNELEEIKNLKSQLERYKPISDIENETVNQKKNLEELIILKLSEVKAVEDNFNKLDTDYKTALYNTPQNSDHWIS